eukprot:GEZU01019562.1.p1 GENE.GEZU01019562.1~~GEZU01019562.1.p1  ORF type:complete len:482 (+),score=196.30 GEZU01019562.1:337-1782(+)
MRLNSLVPHYTISIFDSIPDRSLDQSSTTTSTNRFNVLNSFCTHAAQAQHFNRKKNPPYIHKVVGRQVLDSRGNPTVEVDIVSNGKVVGRASAPSGASTGSNEAREIRDGDESKYLGKGVLTAVNNVNTRINDALSGQLLSNNFQQLDAILRSLDESDLKENIGGNAVTATSFALAEACANIVGKELFEYLHQQFQTLYRNPEQQLTQEQLEEEEQKLATRKYHLPTPMVNILNGGKHAGGKLKIQEFMIVPRRDIEFSEQLMYVTTVYHTLGKILEAKYGKSARNLGDEGGFAPSLDTPDEALKCIEEAIEKAGYSLGKDIMLALDCAASEFYNKETQKYEVIEGKHMTSDELIDYYFKLVEEHPALCSIEDPMDEQDYEGWKKITQKLGGNVMIVGDDLYTTNPRLIKQGIAEKWANALLLKVNQIGTISEAMEAAKLKFDNKNQVIVSHRSGETATTLIADLAVAIGANYIKTGAPAR